MCLHYAISFEEIGYCFLMVMSCWWNVLRLDSQWACFLIHIGCPTCICVCLHTADPMLKCVACNYITADLLCLLVYFISILHLEIEKMLMNLYKTWFQIDCMLSYWCGMPDSWLPYFFLYFFEMSIWCWNNAGSIQGIIVHVLLHTTLFTYTCTCIYFSPSGQVTPDLILLILQTIFLIYLSSLVPQPSTRMQFLFLYLGAIHDTNKSKSSKTYSCVNHLEMGL